jgi:hypothetical protein
MPLDAPSREPEPIRWTIRVELTPQLEAQSPHWSRVKREAFHQLATDAAFAVIDDIQSEHLGRRRDKIERDGSQISFFFRVDAREGQTIRVTVYEFDYHGPNAPEPNGGQSVMPIESLVLDISGDGIIFGIDYVEGEFRVPPKPARNWIISVFKRIRLPNERLNLIFPWNRRNGLALPPAKAGNSIHYSSQRYSGAKLDFTLPYRAPKLGAAPEVNWKSKLLRAFRAFDIFRNHNAASRTPSRPPDDPLRPNGFQ